MQTTTPAIRTLGLAVAGGLLAGCASAPPTAFHELALLNQLPPSAQAGLLLPFDAYVVGIEKDKVSRVGAPVECAPPGAPGDCLDIDAPYFTQRPELRENLRAKFAGQLRPTFVSHVVRFQSVGAPCFLFNVYDGATPCEGAAPGAAAASVAAGWQALAGLGADLDRRMAAQRPTHVLLYTMGWNTAQREAMENIRDLVRELNAAASADTTRPGGGAFRPLVIGVTWPSTGMPTIPAADYGIKAKDADEAGAVWINALIHRSLRPLKQRHGFKLVVVGHSFGARATSRATFSAPLVSADPGPVVDLLLGLQGAYSYQRFVAAPDGSDPEGREGAPYRDFAGAAGTVALTASRHDTAVTTLGHGPYFVGSFEAYQNSRNGPAADRFVHLHATADGRIEGLVCGPSRVLMIDASEVIKTPKPGTGGGAHSGVYTPEVGRLTYALIRRCAS